MIEARSIWIVAGAATLAGACNFDFDAYDPRNASSQAATGSGGLGASSTQTSTQATADSVANTASSATAGGMGGTAAVGGTGGDNNTQACTSKYGSLPGFLLCEATSVSCRFSADVGMTGGNCDGACQQGGGMCLDAFANAPPDLCIPSAMKNCASIGAVNDICICTL